MGVNEVRAYTANRLQWLLSQAEHPQKACLAKLRRGIGKLPGELPELWEILLDRLPEELRSKSGEPSKAEWAIHLSLTLYAMHQQGFALPAQNMNKEGRDFYLGASARRLAKLENENKAEINGSAADSSAAKRLIRLATSTDMREASSHLRGLIKMLGAKGIELDYVQLAGDLYLFQFPEQNAAVKLRWGQDFYRTPADSAAGDKENAKESDHEN